MKLVNVVLVLALFSVVFAGTNGPSPIPNPPNFVITSTTTNLCRGQVNYIPFIVTNEGSNTGSQMQNVELGLTTTKGLAPGGNGTVPVSNINSNSSALIKVPVFVDANASAFISTGVTINYYYDTLYSDSEVRNTSFSTEACALPLSIQISPKILTAGVIQNMTLNLTNSGATTLNAIAVQLSLPFSDGAILSEQPFQINSIGPHSTTYIREQVYISRNASDSMPLNASVSFYNESSLDQISTSIFVLSSGIINMSASGFTISPSLPSPASTFSISFILTDIGTAGASAVTATPLPPAGFTSYGSNAVFVGDIAVDTQTPVTVSFITGNSLRGGNYNIPIRINYLNNLRDNVTIWANQTVTIGELASNVSSEAAGGHFRTASSGAGSGLIILVLIIVIIALLIMRYRDHRRAK